MLILTFTIPIAENAHYIKPREGTKHNLMSAYNGLNKSCLVNKRKFLKMAEMQPHSFRRSQLYHNNKVYKISEGKTFIPKVQLIES